MSSSCLFLFCFVCLFCFVLLCFVCLFVCLFLWTAVSSVQHHIHDEFWTCQSLIINQYYDQDIVWHKNAKTAYLIGRSSWHDDVMNRNTFPITGPLWVEFPSQRSSYADPSCFFGVSKWLNNHWNGRWSQTIGWWRSCYSFVMWRTRWLCWVLPMSQHFRSSDVVFK